MDTPLSRIGSGTVITFGLLTALLSLATSGLLTGWDPTWRSLGVTPLHPFFFDIHVPLDYAACAAKGIDPYVPHACNVANFNIPPIWLWIGRVGLYGSAVAPLLAAILIATAATVLILLLKRRPPIDGAVALAAILSPSILMGIERANPDLLIFTLVGSAALVYDEKNQKRLYASILLSAVATVLKLFPFFMVTLAFRQSRKSIFFAATLGAVSFIYFAAIFPYLILIRRNVPTTYILSYGYKAIFLGFDHLRAEAGLPDTGLSGTWVPSIAAGSVLVFALIVALMNVRGARTMLQVSNNRAGTAFFFGGAIYSGTFLLGTNFIYRLSFLLLCLPQLLDWRMQKAKTNEPKTTIELLLLPLILAVLWSSGDSNGHTTFHVMPQIFDWLLFLSLTSVLFSHAVGSVKDHKLVESSFVRPNGSDQHLAGEMFT